MRGLKITSNKVLSRNSVLFIGGNIKFNPDSFFVFARSGENFVVGRELRKFETLLAFRGQVFNFTQMSITMMSPACLLAGKEAAAPSIHRNNPLHWLMRLDTEYYTHAKREATNWVTCLYLPVIQLISTMHVDHWGMGGRGNEITASRTEHSGVLGKGYCSSKEGVSLSLLTNVLQETKAKQQFDSPTM